MKKLSIKDFPKGWNTQMNEGKGKYFWYYKHPTNPKKDFRSKEYFKEYQDCLKDAIKHLEKIKNKKTKKKK